MQLEIIHQAIVIGCNTSVNKASQWELVHNKKCLKSAEPFLWSSLLENWICVTVCLKLSQLCNERRKKEGVLAVVMNDVITLYHSCVSLTVSINLDLLCYKFCQHCPNGRCCYINSVIKLKLMISSMLSHCQQLC